jgi:hypothetical protein
VSTSGFCLTECEALKIGEQGYSSTETFCVRDRYNGYPLQHGTILTILSLTKSTVAYEENIVRTAVCPPPLSMEIGSNEDVAD